MDLQGVGALTHIKAGASPRACKKRIPVEKYFPSSTRIFLSLDRA